jgi:hypothetical protein
VRLAFNYKGLLNFTAAQKAALNGSTDFMGLNFYSSQWVVEQLPMRSLACHALAMCFGTGYQLHW